MKPLPANLRPRPREPFGLAARAAILLVVIADVGVWLLIAAALR